MESGKQAIVPGRPEQSELIRRITCMDEEDRMPPLETKKELSKRLQFNTMGRVAKYKKVKSFDPYSSKNRGNVNLNQVGIWGLGDSGRKTKKRSRRAEQLRSENKKKRVNNLTKNGGGFDLRVHGVGTISIEVEYVRTARWRE